jgi:uncharacterized damage-inducible protein DinB
MAEDKDALLKRYRDSRAELLAAIDGLSDEALTERSMDGWSVKDHLAHLALWDEIRAAEVTRISAGHESAWRMNEEQDAAYNAIGYAMSENLPIEQVKWELASTRQRLLDAIAKATPRGLDGSLYGEASLRSGHESEHAGWIKQWREQSKER